MQQEVQRLSKFQGPHLSLSSGHAPGAPSLPSAHPAILPTPPPRGTLRRRRYTFIVFRQVNIFPGAEILELSESHGCVIMRKMIYCDAMRLSGPVTVPLLQDNNDAGSPIPVFNPSEAC